MWVIIQGIPLSTTQRELNRFLNKPLNRRGWFRSSAESEIRLKNFSILKMTDRCTGVVECHGLAELESSSPEDVMLQSLNGHQLKGKTIAVRKYYHRTYRVDRQSEHPGVIPGRPERRRPSLHIEMLCANTTGFVSRRL